MVARSGSTKPWVVLAQGTATTATVTVPLGVTELAVWAIFPGGSAIKSPSVWAVQ